MANYLETKQGGPAGWHRRRGLLSTVYGFVVVTLLALATLFGSRLSTDLEDPARSLYPPHLGPAQKLLYDPLDNCTFRPLFGQPDDAGRRLEFSSSPGLTSIVGERYTYHPKLAGGNADEHVTLSVEEGPRGFDISQRGRSFEWIPESPGRYCVTISARTPGASAFQTFELFASDQTHWLGTDRAGRDLLHALVAGARWALVPSLIMAVLAIGIGTLIGGLGGFYGRAVDDVLDFVTEVTSSIPGLLLLFLVAVLSAFNVYVTIAALAILWMPRTARSVRASVVDLKNRDFVDACREMGQSDIEILWKEIVWANDRNQLLAQFFQAVAFAIVIEVTISYLGLGVKLPDISWGVMLKDGRDMAIQANVYWIAAATALTVLITVHGLNSLGRGLIALLGRQE